MSQSTYTRNALIDLERDEALFNLDQRIRQNEGEIIYALDTSEVFNFCLPLTGKLKITYSDTDPMDGHSLNFRDALIRYLLFNLEGTKILLPAHRAEWANLRSALEGLGPAMMPQILAASDEIERKIQGSKIRSKIEDINSEPNDGKRIEKIQDIIFQELPEYISYLTYVVTAKTAKQMSLRRRSEVEKCLLFGHVRPQQMRQKYFKTWNLIYDTLYFNISSIGYRKNSKPQNIADAQGLADVILMNQLPSSEASGLKRYRLVTSSSALFSAYKATSAELHNQSVVMGRAKRKLNFEGDLRPLRSFAHDMLSELVEDEQLAESDKIFDRHIETLRTIRNKGAGAEIRRLRSLWDNQADAALRDYENLAVAWDFAQSSSRGPGRGGFGGLSDQEIIDLSNLLINDSAFGEALEAASDRVIDELVSTAIGLEFVEQDRSHSKEFTKGVFELNERYAKYARPHRSAVKPRFLSSKYGLVPLTIEFYSDEIAQLLEKQAAGDGTIGFTDFARLLSEIVHKPYELRLAFAYLYSVEHRWKYTIRCCNAAISAQHRSTGSPRHEAYYLKAYATRHHESLDANMVQECVSDLESAHKLRINGENGEWDPRYLVELGILAAVSERKKFGFSYNLEEIPGSPLGIWEHALKNTKSLGDLDRLNLLNSIIYWSVENADPITKNRYQKEFFIQVKAVVGENWLNLPPNILHTFYLLFKETSFVDGSKLPTISRRLKKYASDISVVAKHEAENFKKLSKP